MAKVSVKVASYRVQLQDTKLTLSGRDYAVLATIHCLGQHEGRDVWLSIRFMPDGQDLPPNSTTFSEERGWLATKNMHAAHYAWFIDLLRYEKPVYVTISEERPDLNVLRTDQEPVGEHE